MVNRKGAIKAREILKENGLSDLRNFSLEDFAFGRGVNIQYSEIDGAEGRIVFSGDDALITINSAITNVGKKHFVLAHELGHFELHKNTFPSYTDNEKTLNEWYKNGIHELEANDFAKELLMPEEVFSKLCKGKKFNINTIKSLSEEFKTSLSATTLRYKDLGDFPIAIIHLEKNKVGWTQFSEDFVLQYLPKGSPIQPGTVAYDIVINNQRIPDEAEKVDAIDWFPEDFNINKYIDWQFYEYCIKVSPNSHLVILWGF